MYKVMHVLFSSIEPYIFQNMLYMIDIAIDRDYFSNKNFKKLAGHGGTQI
jgi:hypothetical protein